MNEVFKRRLVGLLTLAAIALLLSWLLPRPGLRSLEGSDDRIAAMDLTKPGSEPEEIVPGAPTPASEAPDGDTGAQRDGTNTGESGGSSGPAGPGAGTTTGRDEGAAPHRAPAGAHEAGSGFPLPDEPMPDAGPDNDDAAVASVGDLSKDDAPDKPADKTPQVTPAPPVSKSAADVATAAGPSATPPGVKPADKVPTVASPPAGSSKPTTAIAVAPAPADVKAAPSPSKPATVAAEPSAAAKPPTAPTSKSATTASAPPPAATKPSSAIPPPVAAAKPATAPTPVPATKPASATTPKPADKIASAAAPAPGGTSWYVQAGAYGVVANANGLRDELARRGLSCAVSKSGPAAAPFRVRCGPYPTKQAASADVIHIHDLTPAKVVDGAH